LFNEEVKYITWKGTYERQWVSKELFVDDETKLIRGDIVQWLTEARALMPDKLYETDDFGPLWKLVCSFHKETDEQATLKQMMENLLQKVNDAHTRVPSNSSALSAYGLFSSWPRDDKFKGVYDFCLEANHTSEELFQKYREALQIIFDMYNLAATNYRYVVNGEHIEGVDKKQAHTVLLDIQILLNQAIAKYKGMSLADFDRESEQCTKDLSALLHPNELEPGQFTTQQMHLRHLLNRMQYCIDI
jgi:hypothetical protein